jgi:hypothetical protein
MRWRVNETGSSIKTYRELLVALERARTRLAVAMATENRLTPLERRRYYLDTAERMSRFAKKLRSMELDTGPGLKDCARALQTLRHLPVQETALQLCKILGDIVAELE